MLHADFMIGTDNRPLEERERALDRVRVDIAANPLVSGMVYALVLGFLIANAFVGFVVVGIDVLGIRGVLLNESVKRFAISRLPTVSRILPSRSIAPRTIVLFPVYPRPMPLAVPPTQVSSTSTVPSRGSVSASFMAARIRWQRYQAVL